MVLIPFIHGRRLNVKQYQKDAVKLASKIFAEHPEILKEQKLTPHPWCNLRANTPKCHRNPRRNCTGCQWLLK